MKVNCENFFLSVIPAQAGIYAMAHMATVLWVPACAGTTVLVYDPIENRMNHE